MRRWPPQAIFVLFFLSGLSGLIYEVVWMKLLSHVFGLTVLATSAVLASLMAGLALGSFFFGRVADRINNPLKGLACVEAGIGVLALLFLPLLQVLGPVYVWICRNITNSGCSFCLLLQSGYPNRQCH